MIRGNLPAAMQGLVVVPLFAGYDEKRMTGRLFEYDVTGGRYEERDYAATGSGSFTARTRASYAERYYASTGAGSLHGGTVIKLGFRDNLTRDESIDLAIKALFH